MKKLLIGLMALSLTLGGLNDAWAKRLGGGGSVGMSRNSAPMQRQMNTPPQPAAPAAPAPHQASPQQTAPAPMPQAPQRSGMSRWLGPIAGIAAGIGLAALFSHFGLGEGMANMFMILLLVMAAVFVFRLLFRRPQPQLSPAGGPAPDQRYAYEAAPQSSAAPAPQSSPLGAADSGIPADFDQEGFLRQAKLNFVRLQAANDKGDMEDLKQFTSPELFAEIRLQYEERGRAPQQTDVVQLNASLVEVSTEGQQHIASVRFNGLIRETPQDAPAAFDEVWHLTKPEDGSRGWCVAGIQQLN